MTRELSITYGSFTVGLGTARQITEFVKDGDSYETAWIEFEFITTATPSAAFKTEVDAVRAAFRTPRQDCTITQESQTTLSLKQSDNTGFDASPEILKDTDDPANTGRSRLFRVRIEFGRPADNVSTNYRRWSWVKVEYDSSRQRTVSISGTYTAGGATASFAQYRAQIDAYATTVTSGIDASASWERIGEPEVTRGETDKICDFVAVYREIIFNQKAGTKDDADIIDPQLVITRELEAPGDSAANIVNVGGGSSGGGGTTSPGINSGPNGTVVGAQPPGQSTPNSSGGNLLRPIRLNVSYSASIDYTRTTDLKTKWTGTIRPFIITQVQTYAGTAVILLEDKPNFGDLYKNRFSATMTFMAIQTDIMSRKVTAQDSNTVGKVFHAVWDGDPYSYYKYQGPRVRLRTITEEIEKRTSESDPNKIIDAEVRESGKAQGLAGGDWEMVSRVPKAVSLKTGLDGATIVNVATMTIETTFQLIHEKKASTANAGGITGSTVSGR